MALAVPILVGVSLLTPFQIIRTHLVPDPRGCPLGFESDFARILADLMDSRRRPGKEEEEEEEVRKAAGGQADLPKRAFPASFVEFQRFIRSSIFFLPYLKYSFQMNVSRERLLACKFLVAPSPPLAPSLQIINRSMSEGQVAALNPHFFSMTSHTGQGQVSSPADGSSVGFYSNLARDSERDCATLKASEAGQGGWLRWWVVFFRAQPLRLPDFSPQCR